MCGDFATPNLYAVSQQNCLQALYTRMTVMCRRSGSSSSNDDVERAAPFGRILRANGPVPSLPGEVQVEPLNA